MRSRTHRLSGTSVALPTRRVLVLLLLAATPSLSVWAQEARQKETQLWRAPMVRAAPTFAIGEERLDAPVMFEKITVEGFQKIPDLEFPMPGLLVMQLRAGKVTTASGGDRIERKLGECWVVPPGTRLGLYTDDDKVILAAYWIGNKYLEAAPSKPLASRWDPGRRPFEESARNLFSREADRVGDPERPIARVIDFNVGPGLESEAYRFAGVAVVQVTSGAGTLRVGDREIKADLGESFAASDGERLIVDNRRGDVPLKFRAFVWQK